MNLFGCQTCETCYHANCMSPTLGPDDVPTFWFCPHCVDRQFHIPLDTAMIPAPLPQSAESLVSSSIFGQAATIAPQSQVIEPNTSRKAEGQMISIAGSKQKLHSIARGLSPSRTETSKDTIAGSTKKTSGRPRTTHSPPRKRSKYSAYSSEVDKALAVIHKELESAAQIGRSESSLRERIRTLEQELRLKDGQIQLATRELEMARRNGDTSTLEAEVKHFKEQNDSLKILVESKDSELRDWRMKLKNLLGDDAN
jgi:hypothetical protein